MFLYCLYRWRTGLHNWDSWRSCFWEFHSLECGFLGGRRREVHWKECAFTDQKRRNVSNGLILQRFRKVLLGYTKESGQNGEHQANLFRIQLFFRSRFKRYYWLGRQLSGPNISSAPKRFNYCPSVYQDQYGKHLRFCSSHFRQWNYILTEWPASWNDWDRTQFQR